MPLNLPAGASCFLDANVFYYHYVQTPPFSDECTDLLRRVVLEEVFAFTTTHAIAEAVHKIMLSEAAARFGLTRAGLAAWLGRRPEQVKNLSTFCTAAADFAGLNVSVIEVGLQTVKAAAEVSRRTGILTNDAIITAVMEGAGLVNLITNDDDFDGVAGITVWKPR